jgi:hypothetical protein
VGSWSGGRGINIYKMEERKEMEEERKKEMYLDLPTPASPIRRILNT